MHGVKLVSTPARKRAGRAVSGLSKLGNFSQKVGMGHWHNGLRRWHVEAVESVTEGLDTALRLRGTLREARGTHYLVLAFGMIRSGFAMVVSITSSSRKSATRHAMMRATMTT
jgi:hypothetical protein